MYLFIDCFYIKKSFKTVKDTMIHSIRDLDKMMIDYAPSVNFTLLDPIIDKHSRSSVRQSNFIESVQDRGRSSLELDTEEAFLTA